MSMPWDRFKPDEPEELPYEPPPPPPPVTEPEEPPPSAPDPTEEYVPPPPKPIPTTPVEAPDVKDLAKDILTEAMDYAKAVLGATMKGQDVEPLKPKITAVTAAGKELVVADARSRSWRTLVQGLGIDLFAALCAAVALASGMDPLAGETWLFIGALLVKTLVQTAVAYFMRLKVTPTVRERGEKKAIVPLQRPMLDEDGA